MRTTPPACSWLLFGALACSEVPSLEPEAGGASGAKAGPGGSVGGSESAAGGTAGVSAVAGVTGVAGSSSGAAAGGATAGGATAGGATAGGGQSQAGAGAGGVAVGGSGSSCSSDVSTQNRALVANALDALFVDKQVSAIDQYWADPYLQHNPVASSGVATFKSIMGPLVASPSFSYERLRTLAECDLAVVQGRYSGTGVIFDMFRIADGKLVEHWDSDAGQASDAGGTSDNPSGAASGQNREVALAFIRAVLIEAKLSEASQHLGPSYVWHRTTGSGPQAFSALVTADSIVYTKVHHVIADGSFVFTLSEGTLAAVPHAFYDLFRVEAGQIVEHWDSRRRVPSSTTSGLGIF